ncbi:MAG: hypothetical protein ACSLEX_03355 [Minisyncoccota bacterium]
MIRTFFLSIVLVISGMLFSVQAPMVLSATGTDSTADCVNKKAGVCFPSDTGLAETPVAELLMSLMNWLLAIIGFIAIIAFIISGLQYLTAVGDEKRAETAKDNMRYAIIGIIVALSGWIIISAINTWLSGGTNF